MKNLIQELRSLLERSVTDFAVVRIRPSKSTVGKFEFTVELAPAFGVPARADLEALPKVAKIPVIFMQTRSFISGPFASEDEAKAASERLAAPLAGLFKRLKRAA